MGHIHLSPDEINALLGIDNADVVQLDDGSESLSIFCRRIRLESMSQLLDWAANRKIEDITLNDCGISDSHVEIITKHPICNRLDTLDLRDNDITVKSAKMLTESLLFNKLDTLDVSENNITNKGAILIIKALSTTLYSVTNLGISCIGMRNESYLELLMSPVADRLKCIDVGQSPIRESTLKLLHEKYGDRLLG
ncbi:MAG: hypothetical protein ACRC8S_09820 [Fimbriiglobus sp.]